MAYGSVNVPGASEAKLAEVNKAAEDAKNVAQGVSDKVGATNDTGGSTTAGTVMGKLNKLISDLTTHMGRWTAARASYIDTIKSNTDTIKASTDKVGAANDTGGSTSAGTIMGKLNKLISDITTHAASWTAARAGYIDTIKTDVAAVKTDAAAAKSNTAASNTASATGTLSQKLSHVINLLTSGDVSDKLDEIVAKGAVKSVQRGIAKMTYTVTSDGSLRSTNINDLSIQINTVDPNKCMVIFDGVAFASSYGGNPPYVHSLTSNELTVKASNTRTDVSASSAEYNVPYGSNSSFGWQVIEFY